MTGGDDSAPAASDPGGSPEGATEPASEGPRYARQGLLGAGGMGRVYAARDARLRRQVALKVAATPELARRLAREAWITAQLEHPGIVAVYDAGETDGEAWYTMRLIRGRTLRERLAACPDVAARLALVPHLHAACQAVAYAHAMGIVHRDLKPSNVMVGEFGETQVADWGLATPLAEVQQDWQRIAGTPRYMSPEQSRGDAPSRAADVYGLGAALWELLSGAPPRPDGEAPPPPGAPPELVAVARRCLHPDPAARYPSAAELADELDRWLSGRRVHAHEYRAVEHLQRLVRRWRWPLAVAALGLVVVAGAVAVGWERTRQARALAEANLAVALGGQAVAAVLDERLPEAQVLAAHALGAGPSPDARGVLAAAGPAPARLMQREVLPARCRRVGVLSPDTRWLACAAEGTLEVWSTAPVRRVRSVPVPVVHDPAWQGERLYVATPDGLSRVDGEQVTPLLIGGGWRPIAAEGVVYAVRGRDAQALVGEQAYPFEVCHASRTATAAAGRDLLLGCDDGHLHRHAPDGSLLQDLGPQDTAWSAVVGAPAGLYAGGLSGEVRAWSAATGAWTPPLAGPSRSVVALLPVPGSSAVLVLGERGGPRIWSTRANAWAGALPAGVSRLFAGTAPGEVLLLGDTLDRWSIPLSPSPMVLNLEAGASQAVPSPDGSRLAIALGTGAVVEHSVADGAELRRWTLPGGVVKCVTYDDRGRLVASAIDAPAEVLDHDGAVSPLGTSVLRRVGRLSGGRAWALQYGAEVLLIGPDGTVAGSQLGPGPFDGSSSDESDTAVVLDARGGIWRVVGDTWVEVRREPDAVAVDVGRGGAPLVYARTRELCVDGRCQPLDQDVTDLALAADRVAVGTLGGDIFVFRASTGELLATLRGHSARISSVEFTPGGASLVSASWDKTVRRWSLDGLDATAAQLVTQLRDTWGLELHDAMRIR